MQLRFTAPWGIWTICCVLAVPATAQDRLDVASARLDAAVPKSVDGFREPLPDNVAELCEAVDSAATTWATQARSAPQGAISRLIKAHQQVTVLGDRCLALRGEFSPERLGPLDREQGSTEEVEKARAAVRRYLLTSHQLLDLAGRVRYTLVDALQQAWSVVEQNPRLAQPLLSTLIDSRSDVGAVVLAKRVLPLAASNSRARAAAPQVLRLIALSGQTDTLPDLAAYVRQRGLSASQLLEAIETIERLGIPQDARPGQADDVPAPAITAGELHALVNKLPAKSLDAEAVARRTQLLQRLDGRSRTGLPEERLTLGRYEIRPGDWLLMRNPSPFNLFTDLAPGLFTHVGVVALETGSDGRRRMVVVDLPEHGSTMPATNADVFLARTLHYVFLRHREAEVQQAMAQAAQSVIGNEIEFDLNFRTERLEELRGKPLAGAKIKTYCAGLLLLCAQETGRPRSEFFPLPEYPAGGHALENVSQLGMSVGRDFVSPSGALFSPALEIVARREPMYDPTREIEEAVYDHFAQQLQEQRLRPSPSWTQSLKQRLAEASRWNGLLAKALAGAAGVSADTDLVSAAKTSAVIESLDEIAKDASAQFLAARDAMRSGSEMDLRRNGMSRAQVDSIRRLRGQHAGLYRQWSSRQLAPRDLRRRLVDYYLRQGQRQLDDRFFEPATNAVLGQDR